MTVEEVSKLYSVNDRVKTYDEGEWIYGKVTFVSALKIKVEWDDLHDPCEHTPEEFNQIIVVKHGSSE